jgi:hypothetical protein
VDVWWSQTIGRCDTRCSDFWRSGTLSPRGEGAGKNKQYIISYHIMCTCSCYIIIITIITIIITIIHRVGRAASAVYAFRTCINECLLLACLLACLQAPIRKFSAMKDLVATIDCLVNEMKKKCPTLSGLFERSDAMVSEIGG